MSLESLDCPNCGAPLPDAEGRTVVVCRHCGSSVRLAPPAAPRPPETAGEYGLPPSERPARSQLASVTLGASDVAHVIQLLRDKQRLAAIQFYQAKAGGSLGEAKEAIEAIEAGLKDASAPLPPPSASSQPPRMSEISELVKSGRKLEAIKRYREMTGVGLREALTVVEGIERQQGRTARGLLGRFRSARGCLSVAGIVVVFFLLISGGCGVYLQTTCVYRCSMRTVLDVVEARRLLEPPVRGGYLVLVPGFESSGGFGGSELGAEYFAPVWGTGGIGLAYVNLYTNRTGYAAMSATLFLGGERHELRPWGELPCQ